MKQSLMQNCQNHWRKLKIKDENDLKKIIVGIFQSQNDQRGALFEIYKLALPEWDRIERVNGFPEVGRAFWQFICRQFIEFDRLYHPQVFAGGLWLNNGFQSNSALSPWELSFANCSVVYSQGSAMNP